MTTVAPATADIPAIDAPAADRVRKAKALLMDVVERCSKDRHALFPADARLVADGKTKGVVLFGLRSPTVGEHLRAVEEVVAATPGLEMRALVDDAPAELALGSMQIPILTPKEFFEQAGRFSDCIVVDRYSTWMPGVKYKAKLRQAGIPFMRLEQFLNAPGLVNLPGYYRGNSDYMLAHLDEHLAIGNIWADTRSAEVYYTALAGFISMDYTYFALGCDDHRERYFPSDVGYEFGEDSVLADCGAYDGAEALIFARKTANRFRAIHSFEPDRTSFLRLSRNMARYMAESAIDNIFSYPLGVYDRNDYLRFSGAATLVCVSNESVDNGPGLRVARLDDVLDEITHLRLEIEGAEVPALRGAAGLIRAHRPTLAVSTYHLPDDFLTIHRQIESFDLNYRFRLRHQSLEAGVLCYHCI